MPNERWSTNRRAKFSFKHSIGRTRRGRFFLYACRINYVQLLTLIVDIRGRRHEATYGCQVKIPFHHGLRYSDESIWEQPFQKSFDSHYLHRRQCNAKLSLYSYRVGLHCSAFTPHLSNLTTRNTGDRQNLTKVLAKETCISSRWIVRSTRRRPERGKTTPGPGNPTVLICIIGFVRCRLAGLYSTASIKRTTCWSQVD